ncbi:MAG: replication-associated recombination protein A [Candidatus Saccharibacteria bacterium]|nr:replication-associated recombination protein A [Candidatus Saccharibacteria bacterium]
MEEQRPLADRMRPKDLSEIVGQRHLVDKGKIIQRIVAKKQPTSLIFWGPAGSGKTTLARIIARETEADFIELSAVTAGKADIKQAVTRARGNQVAHNKLQQRGLWVDATHGSDDAPTEAYSAYGEGAQQAVTPRSAARSGGDSGSPGRQTATPQFTILFIDEIHRFNKAQQDTLLPHVEDGTITLIGATTENPSFEVINPLLSRSRVLTLEPLSKNDVTGIIKSAAKAEKLTRKKLPLKSIDLIAELSGGDARVALGNLELARQLAGNKTITDEIVKTAAQKRAPGYDKDGEMHYNVISAFIKSMRGGDVTATLYYLARMLQAGEDPKFIARRMIIFASEDVGLAASAALNLPVSTFQAVERIGLPECEYNLYHCATVLAKTDKSRQVADAMGKAKRLASEHPDAPVPLHIRNAPTELMKDLGYGKGTRWEAGFKHPKGFLPDELKDLEIM